MNSAFLDLDNKEKYILWNEEVNEEVTFGGKL